MSSTGNKPHHMGDYPRRARALRAWGNANPDARCARCGKTLAQHPRTKSGRPPTWSAGHVVDGQVGGQLRLEVLSCNAKAGTTARNAKRRRTELTL